ncbi:MULTISPECIES: hypothetical protein [Rugamonas]|jgi:hypothetical protein|uniref:Uncharacterized protein n=1 Tax=Rugamonas rubra TaxID=758825 RepID=A0A1I4R8Y6_9BURK|nr:MULTISPECIES: hypothetical protein [Rugamonas]WGG51330.1 hypothetical protein QC826_03410 [Rugamonas sp. DEMB1]SFM48635.1 hypothetical protein SAMN02982985_04254 [Rugamonas rubra]
MKVRQLMAILSKCDPEGVVTLSLPLFDDSSMGLKQVVSPIVTPLFSATAQQRKGLPDWVSIEIFNLA